MKYLRVFTLGLMALHSAAWAEIYETQDAQGNPVFTDSPTGTRSDVVDLPEINIADAPPPESLETQQRDVTPVEHAPVVENNPVIIHDANPGEELSEERLRKQREYERENPSARHEVLDAEPRHEVLDAEPRHEVGDFPEETDGNVDDYPEGYEHVRHPEEGGRAHPVEHRGGHRR
jgi:hypothetical protein